MDKILECLDSWANNEFTPTDNSFSYQFTVNFSFS